MVISTDLQADYIKANYIQQKPSFEEIYLERTKRIDALRLRIQQFNNLSPKGEMFEIQKESNALSLMSDHMSEIGRRDAQRIEEVAQKIRKS